MNRSISIYINALGQLDAEALDVAASQFLFDEEAEGVGQAVRTQGAQDAQLAQGRLGLPLLWQALAFRKLGLDDLAPTLRRRLDVAVQVAEFVCRCQTFPHQVNKLFNLGSVVKT